MGGKKKVSRKKVSGKKSSARKLTKIEKAHHSLAIIYFIIAILFVLTAMSVLMVWYQQINDLMNLFNG